MGSRRTIFPAVFPRRPVARRHRFQHGDGASRQHLAGLQSRVAASGFVKGVPRTIDPLQHNLSFYIQDGFRLKPSLTLQLGVRYEYQGVFDLRNGLVLLPQDGEARLWGADGSTICSIRAPRRRSTIPCLISPWRYRQAGLRSRPQQLCSFLRLRLGPRFEWKDGDPGELRFPLHAGGFTLFQLVSTGNNGLLSVLQNSTPPGVFSTSSKLDAGCPDCFVSRSQRENFIAANDANLWFFNGNLPTPYVLEWTSRYSANSGSA